MINLQSFKAAFFLLSLIASPTLMATQSEVKIGGPWWNSLKEIQGTVFGDLSPTNDFPVEENVATEKNQSVSSSNTADTISTNTKSRDGITNIKPDNIEVITLIRQWIANAEPPLNAKGAQLHYDKWGRTVGRAKNYIVKVTAKPDNVSGRTPEKYAWDIRNNLDSLNHCTLERYVQLHLAKQSIEQCKNRYKPQLTADSKSTIKLPNLRGMGYKKALSKLKEAGLIVLPPELGNSAKTLEKVGTIERIQPEKNGPVHRGDKVTPILLGKVANTTIIVPNVIGLGIKKAETVIKSAGLIPIFELGEKTEDQLKDKTIARQAPSKGTDIKQGNKVKLFIFTYKSNKQRVPNLSGMKLSEAKKVLQKANLTMLPELGRNAAKARDVGRIYQQTPKPGSKTAKDTTVKVHVYGKNQTAETITSSTSLKTNSSKNVASGNIFILDRVEMQKTADPKDSCGSDQSCYRHTGNGGDGKFDDYYTYSKGKVTAGWKYYNSSRSHADYIATFLFDSPPARLIPDETLKLKIKASGKGFAKFGSGSSSRHFSYFIQYDGGEEQHLKDSYVEIKSTSLPKQGGRYQGEIKKETVTTVTLPKKVKKEIIIKGKFSPNPAFTIRWIYKPAIPKTISNKIPDLIGLKASKAKSILQKMGLSMSPVLGSAAKSEHDIARVYTQNPKPGQELKKGEIVNVTIYGKYPKKEASVKDKNQGIPQITFPDQILKAKRRSVSNSNNNSGTIRFPDNVITKTSYYAGRYLVATYNSSDDLYKNPYSDWVQIRIVWLSQNDDIDGFDKKLSELGQSPTGYKAKYYIDRGMKRSYILLKSKVNYVYLYGNSLPDKSNEHLLEKYTDEMEKITADLLNQVEIYTKKR